jgi:Holliday junction resolvase RusA-like endonuclease
MMTVSPEVTVKPFLCARLLTLPPGINRSYKIASISPKHKPSYRRLCATQELATFKESALYELSRASVDWRIVEAIRTSSVKVPLALTIRFYFPTLWRRDIDGGVKAVQDSVFQYLALNDNLIVEKYVSKAADPECPRVEIELRCVVGR